MNQDLQGNLRGKMNPETLVNHIEPEKLCQSARITHRISGQANHTFSSQTWRDEVATQTVNWLIRTHQIS